VIYKIKYDMISALYLKKRKKERKKEREKETYDTKPKRASRPVISLLCIRVMDLKHKNQHTDYLFLPSPPLPQDRTNTHDAKISGRPGRYYP
jgi:hypothetical protein